ncbi:hypothetical protein [Sessilibacter corallicola]|uniref:hypothetical protein n=1 Tax=Sessilibacter corallicola TaxID=2904075 RepID=UPI0033407AA7
MAGTSLASALRNTQPIGCFYKLGVHKEYQFVMSGSSKALHNKRQQSDSQKLSPNLLAQIYRQFHLAAVPGIVRLPWFFLGFKLAISVV